MVLPPSPKQETPESLPKFIPDPVKAAIECEIIDEAIKNAVVSESYESSINDFFGSLTDPRKTGMVRHQLMDIITIAVCAVICGANDWVGVATFAKAQELWLRQFLSLPNGIPSHDTFNALFNRINAEEFQSCFSQWMAHLFEHSEGKVISIDGKRLRRSYDKNSDKAAIHMVSAWVSENRAVLGQVKTDDKSNEITAIPKLLKLLDIKGCIITIDAMGCQRKIAKQIIDAQGDYVLALKGNQSSLHDDIRLYFETAIANNFKEIAHSYHEDTDAGHGRIEIRRCWVINEIEWLQKSHQWPGMSSIVMIESERHLNDGISVEHRFYISSLLDDAQKFNRVVRLHWGIENQLHWTLDVTFNEDQSRLRTGHGAENFAVIRHVAVSLLSQDKSSRIGIANRRIKAATDQEYRLNLLTGMNN